jgi:ribosome-binding protein aMBF1 (putative translation factor)
MTSRPAKLSDQIRQAVDASGTSRYRIAKELGIAESTLSRFMSRKGGLSMDNLDALSKLLGLKLAEKKPTAERSKRQAKKGR